MERSLALAWTAAGLTEKASRARTGEVLGLLGWAVLAHEQGAGPNDKPWEHVRVD